MRIWPKRAVPLVYEEDYWDHQSLTRQALLIGGLCVLCTAVVIVLMLMVTGTMF